MIHRPDIALDIDGVLANFGKHAAVWAQRLGLDIHTRPDRWYMQKEFFSSGEDWFKLWDRIKKDPLFWFSIEPFYDDVGLAFVPAAYISARDSSLTNCTVHWLARKGFPKADVYCTDTFEAKVDILHDLHIERFVDDRSDAFTHYRACGVDCRLMDRPWNQHVDTRYRIYNINEVL